ncbi:MAG: hypothetical protein OJF49_000984 [Ktedonobacterales bacterium]|jgi:hypothetical protein|nr:MAG: hypothetical protein OJF49_000984 [Ktedonobacterales bacterium]
MANIAKLYAQLLGIVLTLVGLLGFVGALAPDSRLLGIFAIDPFHNVIHLLSGIVGLLAGFAAGSRYARLYAGVFGVVYGLVTVVGFIQGTTVLGLISVNLADNVLHLLIAVASLGVFFLSSDTTTAPARA